MLFSSPQFKVDTSWHLGVEIVKSVISPTSLKKKKRSLGFSLPPPYQSIFLMGQFFLTNKRCWTHLVPAIIETQTVQQMVTFTRPIKMNDP